MNDLAETLRHLKAEMHERLTQLKTERDELRVRIHLAKAEVLQEWEKAEATWAKFQARTEVLGKCAGDAGRDVGTAARLLGDEIQHAYRRIRDALSRYERP